MMAVSSIENRTAGEDGEHLGEVVISPREDLPGKLTCG